jgi:hypothetical protein
MQTERDYLASLDPPLAIAGARGRFSTAAKAELVRARAAGMIFREKGTPASTHTDSDASDSIQRDLPVVYAPIKSPPIVRDIGSMKGYTVEGFLVETGVCMKCCQHVNRCPCKAGIAPSSITVRWHKDSKEYGIDLPALT